MTSRDYYVVLVMSQSSKSSRSETRSDPDQLSLWNLQVHTTSQTHSGYSLGDLFRGLYLLFQAKLGIVQIFCVTGTVSQKTTLL